MKKLVALFLALALCLSLCTVTAFADETLTISDILNKCKGGSFPTASDDNIPTNAWRDENGNYMYIKSAFLEAQDGNNKSQGLVIFSKVEKTGNNYTHESAGEYGGKAYSYTLVFNMTNGDLTSIKATYSDEKEGLEYVAGLSGTYYPPKGDDDGHDWDYETLAKVGMAAAGVVAGVVVTKIVVDKLHEIKAAKDATAEATPEINVEKMPMVAFGDSGDAVTTLQTELNAQGYACGEADGVFGQNTLNAVIAFQTAKGLTADGIVGAQTWGALL